MANILFVNNQKVAIIYELLMSNSVQKEFLKQKKFGLKVKRIILMPNKNHGIDPLISPQKNDVFCFIFKRKVLAGVCSECHGNH